MSDRLQLLEDLLRRLRGPEGCPWDREQKLTDLRAYLLEEAHEVAAAIDSGDLGAVGEELGDLLFQAVFVAHLIEEEGGAGLATIVRRVHAKMVKRHPHVFGDEKLHDAAAVRLAWEKRKASRREGSILQGIPATLPVLVAAYRMTQKAAGIGFDWPSATEVLDKLDEEIGELRQAIAADAGGRSEAAREEVGDLLFTAVNLARKLGIDPAVALAQANHKFRRRFRYIETTLAADGRRVETASSAELEELWRRSKRG